MACGFDASGTDPLSRMMAGADTFQALTEMTMQAAGDLCEGKPRR
jgi:acetoin utilization deacetylase AcuC-like enzyme